MSLVFSDTSTYRGIVQIYEKEIGAEYGDISGSTPRLKSLTADVNLALDDFVALAIKSSGTWQFDDSNQGDYPIITTNLTSGQRDYSFTTDGSGNLILDIYQVFVANPSGIFREVLPVDVQSQSSLVGGVLSGNLGSGGDLSGFWDGRNTTGTPNKYDKTANGIFLDPIPNYNSSGGLKVYINREGSYFVSTDTTKKPGVPGIFHKYFALKPALDYARRNNLAVLPRLEAEVLRFEGNERLGVVGAIQEYFSRRPRDEQPRLIINQENNR